MITTAPIASKPATAQIAGNIIGAGPVVEYRDPVTRPIIKALNPITIETIHRIQAIIVARALKIGGIPSSFIHTVI
jgi:hypothetical protein